jgi:tetratricopeptide (TPR) repeat protein
MKLSSSVAGRISSRQARLCAILGLAGGLIVPARGDIIVTKTITHTGEVIGVTASGVQIKVAIGELTIPREDIVSTTIDKPVALDAAVAAAKAQNFQEAVTGLKPIIDHYAGLRLPWVEEAMLRLGDAYIGLKDFASAKRIFDSFKSLYPASPQTAGLDVKYARVLSEQKDYAKALEALNSFLELMLKRDFLTDEQETAVAEALVLRGDCLAATTKRDAALDDYLKVVTLFDYDADRAAEAKYKAARLFEDLGNWKRARDSYDEMLKEGPPVALADEIKRRLADITKAHPE